MNRRFTDEQEAVICCEYVTGASMIFLARKWGSRHTAIKNCLVRGGVSVRPKIGDKQAGPTHSQWTGGRVPTGDGYMRLWVAPDDPMVSMCRPSDGHYVLEHRLVVARHIGRPLRADETVHHKDGNRSHNLVENLQLRTKKNHGAGQAFVCGACGSNNIEATELAA